MSMLKGPRILFVVAALLALIYPNAPTIAAASSPVPLTRHVVRPQRVASMLALSARGGVATPGLAIPASRFRGQSPATRLGTTVAPPPRFVSAAGLVTGPQTAASVPAAVGSTSGFQGLAQCGACGLEPPDPWVAVGTSDVVQAVNTTIRISSRSGQVLATVPFDQFFLEPTGQVQDADPRVLWDPGKGRWIASELSYDCASGHLYLAVSDGADPTAGWSVYSLPFAGSMPDYPGLGVSSDKVVISSNQYMITTSVSTCTIANASSGATLDILDWSQLLAGGTVSYSETTPDPTLFDWRPATALSSTTTLPAIGEDYSTGNGDIGYATITGTNASGTVSLSSVVDLTTAGIVSGVAAPPVPVGATAFTSSTVDGRITDAFWQAGTLWSVSTYPCKPTGDSVARDCVRASALDTSTATPSLSQDFLVGSAGYDFFLGGIGLASNGTLFLVFSVSSSTSYISTYATAQLPTDPPDSYQPLTLVRAGQAIYGGSGWGARWGDYVGVAQDPSNAAAVWQGDEYPNADGTWGTWVSQLALATVPGAPTAATASAGNAQAAVSWTAPASNGGSPITAYTVTSSPGAMTCATGGAPACTVTGLTNGTAYTFTVTATNAVGTGPASAPSNSVIPATVPGAPTAATASAGNAQAAVSWTAPASNGGSPITAYTVTSSPGAMTCATGGAPACTVTGLTNGTAYTFTVTATNAVGTGPASAPSNAVVPTSPVVRYAGATRFATAAAVSAHTFSPGVPVAYIAYAFNFPDALAGAAAAGTVKGPVLLAATNLPLDASTTAELTRLKPAQIIVLGGTGVISDAVMNALKPYATSATVVRYAGATRFATAAAVSAHTFSPGVPVAYIAYAFNFPDALAGAAAAGTVKGPVLLAATNLPLDASTTAELTRLKPAQIIVLGGTGVISDAVMNALKPYATGP